MRSDPDEEALSWGGDDEPASAAGGADPGQARHPGSATVVGFGILAGVYLLYTAGWLVSVLRDPYTLAHPAAEALARGGDGLAVASPAVWLATALLITRGRPAARTGWMLAGLVLLAPWPFILGGAR